MKEQQMRAKLILSSFFVFAVLCYFSINIDRASASYEDPEGGCCQEVCLTEKDQPKAGCMLILSHNGSPIDTAVTDSLGMTTFCNLEEGWAYSIATCASCNISGFPPSFTACTKSCVAINCE